MENSSYKSEAQEAYKKFIKSSKGILGLNLKKRENLKSFSEIQKEENAYNSIDLGIKEVSIKKIIGSVEKFEDFDENFIPKNNIVRMRWENIYLAHIKDETLPPIILYKIKDFYYVYDGNHRVSVAKYLNFVSIEAEVQEFLPSTNKKEEVIYRESMIFEKETGLSDILFSNPIRYKYLKNEISSYIEKLYGNDKKIEYDDKEYKIKLKEWYLNIFEPIKNIILDNNLLLIYKESNINDVFSFFLEHKYYLSKNFSKDVGYSYSIINFINLTKTRQNKNFESKFIIKEKNKNWDKLLRVDFLKEINTSVKLEYDKVEKNSYSYFINKIKRLPNKYENYFLNITKKENNIFKYISNYCKIIHKKSIYDLKDIREVILNYIVEIFIPIVEISKSEEKFLKNYEKIQNDFFFLLENEKALISEGKIIKYEDIIENIVGYNILDNISVKKIILNEKINELFKNLKYNNKFSEIYNEYGKINEYLTLEVFFKLMDNMGETEFIKKLENEIYQLKNSDELIKYKTESVLSVLSGEDSFSFIDYYVRNIENYKKVIE